MMMMKKRRRKLKKKKLRNRMRIFDYKEVGKSKP